ncbi:MAG: undecaprenyl-diphosphate phosphatase, partial [Alphaproteobacteria bacterium]
FQMLAPIPGVSRSGITMTAARFLGYERVEAARFSLLLSMPVIIGAGTLAGSELYNSGNVVLGFDALLAMLLAFVSALIALALMMRWLRRASFTPFVIYRLCLGAGLLIWSYA